MRSDYINAHSLEIKINKLNLEAITIKKKKKKKLKHNSSLLAFIG